MALEIGPEVWGPASAAAVWAGSAFSSVIKSRIVKSQRARISQLEARIAEALSSQTSHEAAPLARIDELERQVADGYAKLQERIADCEACPHRAASEELARITRSSDHDTSPG